MRKTTKTVKLDSLIKRHFFNLLKLGIEIEDLPSEHLVSAKKFFIAKLNSHQLSDLRIKTNERNTIADQLSKMAIIVQGFGVFALGLTPEASACFDIRKHAHYSNLAKKNKRKLFNEAEYFKRGRTHSRYNELINKIYYLNEFGYEANKVPIEKISIQVYVSKEFTGLLHEDFRKQKSKSAIKSKEKIKLPPELYGEFMISLEHLIEKYIGRIEMYKDISARKQHGLTVLTEMVKLAACSFYRHGKTKRIKNQTPNNKEATLIALLLIASGFLPTKAKYDEKPVKNGPTQVYKRSRDGYARLTNEAKIVKQAVVPYWVHVRGLIQREPSTLGEFYKNRDYSAITMLNEIA